MNFGDGDGKKSAAENGHPVGKRIRKPSRTMLEAGSTSAVVDEEQEDVLADGVDDYVDRVTDGAKAGGHGSQSQKKKAGSFRDEQNALHTAAIMQITGLTRSRMQVPSIR